MLKGILAGIVAGALATAGVLKGLAMRQPQAAADRAESPAAVQPDAGALKSRAEGLREGNASLQKMLDDRKAELAALEKKDDGGGKKKKKKAGEKTWKELAPLLLKAFGGEGSDRDSKELQAAQLDFMALIARIAKQRGISMDEAMASPEGLPQLLRAMLEIGTPPASPEQMARVDELIAKYAKDWEKVRADDATLTKLEQKLAIGELADGYMQGVLDTMSQDQKDSSKSFDMFGMMSDGMGGGTHYASGTREAVTSNLTDAWAKALKIDADQKAQLGPYVESFMKDFETAQDRVQSGGGQDRSYWKRMQREQARAQIRAQQAMAAGLSLSPKQQKALHDWGTTYHFWFDQPASTTPETPEDE